MSDSETPGQRLRTVRKQQGMTAEMLAVRVGISPSAVRNQENGTNGFSATRAAEYAEVLGLTPQWLLYGDDGGEAARGPLPRQSPVALTKLPNGKARLEMSTVLPFSVALQILALVQGDEK